MKRSVENPLRPIERVSVKEQALERLKDFIIEQAIEPGQRLPSERELAEQLGIGRPSVREALKILEAVGLVESRIGEGTFISNQSGASFGRIIGINLAARGGALLEVLRARQIIEVECARVAALEATAEDLEALEQVLAQMQQSGISFSDYLTADMQFHRLIAHATHNGIIEHIVDNLVASLEEMVREEQASQLPLFVEGQATHSTVFTMIAERNAEGAASSMRQHLHFSTELWQALVSLGGLAASDVQIE